MSNGAPKLDGDHEGKFASSLRVGIHINPAWLVVLIVVGAFNAGVMWMSLNDFKAKFNDFQARLERSDADVKRITQTDLLQTSLIERLGRQVDDHETRLRTQELRAKSIDSRK